MEGFFSLIWRRFRSIALGFVLVLLLPNIAWTDHLPPAVDERELEVGYVEFPPYEYTNEQGEAAGILIDLTRDILERAGYQARFHPLPTARLYLYLKQGKIHLWPGLRNIPSLQEHVLESSFSPIEAKLNAWFLDGTPPITNIDDMRGYRVIVIAGYTYSGLLYHLRDANNKFKTITTPTHRSALQMLELGRGDYLLDYVDPIREELNQTPIHNLKSAPLISQKGAFLISRQVPHAARIHHNIEDAFRALYAEGLIKQKYPTVIESVSRSD